MSSIMATIRTRNFQENCHDSTTTTGLLTPSRREFLQDNSSAGRPGRAAACVAGPCRGRVHAAGSDLLRVGLVGCGGRGTGAAAQALQADKNVKLVAMADAFEDRAGDEPRQPARSRRRSPARSTCPPDRQFVGFDAYKQLIASGVDVVLLCAPPHFRPLHLKAAVDAGKHVFAEKPVAVDAPGVRSVLETCEEAKKKNLSVVSGLCLRYSHGFQETVKRIHDGPDRRGPHRWRPTTTAAAIWVKPREPDWTDMHWQMRNWYYFTWLSGDFNVEQHVHFLDVCAWVMKDQYPVRRRRHGRPPGPHRAGVRQHLRPSQRGLRVRQRRQALQQHAGRCPAAQTT